MLIGFSSYICPEWDLQTLLSEGKALGFNAIELNGLHNHPHLPACPELNDAPNVLAAFEATGIKLLSIVADSTVGVGDGRTQARSHSQICETLDLADKLRCPYVVVKTAPVASCHNPDPVLRTIVAALQSLAPYAAERNLNILVENSGTFASSRDMWYLLDAVGHPAVRCCWNPCRAATTGDTPSLSVPRLGAQTALTYMFDAIFDKPKHINRYVPPGHGQIDWGKYLQLMRGIGADLQLILTWPSQKHDFHQRDYMSASRTWLDDQLKRIDAIQELTAYKGDKNAPRFASGDSRAANA